MNPQSFEKYVAGIYEKEGYDVTVTPYSGDYGVDVIAEKGGERIAVQVKQYGGSARKVNRQMVMELHGAAAYAGCNKAVIATNGDVLPDAFEVARKIGVEIRYIDSEPSLRPVIDACKKNNKPVTVAPETKKPVSGVDYSAAFRDIWDKYVKPLEGKTLLNDKGRKNTILKVDDGGIKRITSTGNIGKIDIEPFKMAVIKLLREGCITRSEINDNYSKRASSGIVLILSQVPVFELMERPLEIQLDYQRIRVKQYPKGMFCKIKNIFYLCCWSVSSNDIRNK